MQVVHYRLGHATNSSSAHYIVRRATIPNSVPPDGDHYGWDHFTLVTPEEKSNYFAAGVAAHYRGLGLDEHDVSLLALAAFPLAAQDAPSRIIDHQSEFRFPIPVGRSVDSLLFDKQDITTMENLWAWIRVNVIDDPNVIILGGNDNDGLHPLLKSSTSLHLPFYSNGRFLFDSQNEMITLYNPKNGAKVRLATGEIPEQSWVPEMVDLTITDKCTKGCEFCYRNCNHDGEHADWSILERLIYILRKMGTFEVAIGGGEPTEYPKFAQLLQLCHSSGITPNFSTGSLTWLGSSEIVEAVQKYCGAVAFSTQNPEEAAQWFSLAENHKLRNPAIHFIMGLSPLNVLKEMLQITEKNYGSSIVLLKYKNLGRAKSEKPKKYSIAKWAQIIEQSKLYQWEQEEADKMQYWRGQIALDSGMAELAAKRLKTVDPRTLGSEDGHFTMYYDAVNQRCAIHSFVSEADMRPCGPYDIHNEWLRMTGQLKEEKN